jgi:hypothetical protein
METPTLKFLNAQEILAVNDVKIEAVPVPEWGGSVLVRSLEGYERDQYETQWLNSRAGKKVTLDNIRARLVAMSLCDAEGNRLFTDSQVKTLGKKSAAALDRIFTVAQKLSGLTQEDIKELEKNSESLQNDNSGLN